MISLRRLWNLSINREKQTKKIMLKTNKTCEWMIDNHIQVSPLICILFILYIILATTRP